MLCYENKNSLAWYDIRGWMFLRGENVRARILVFWNHSELWDQYWNFGNSTLKYNFGEMENFSWNFLLECELKFMDVYMYKCTLTRPRIIHPYIICSYVGKYIILEYKCVALWLVQVFNFDQGFNTWRDMCYYIYIHICYKKVPSHSIYTCKLQEGHDILYIHIWGKEVIHFQHLQKKGLSVNSGRAFCLLQ